MAGSPGSPYLILWWIYITYLRRLHVQYFCNSTLQKMKTIVVVLCWTHCRIITCRNVSMLYGLWSLKAHYRLKYAAKPSKQRRRKGDINADNKPGLISYSSNEKVCNYCMSRYCSGTRDHHFTPLSELWFAIHPLWCLHILVTMSGVEKTWR